MNRGGKTTLYLLVSNDEYELPLAVTDTANELAEICGIKQDSIYTLISKHKGNYRKVVIDEDK
jgi:ribosomal protein L7Ae-like RNA K-turn-binding protein